jgi:hypothetical protein
MLRLRLCRLFRSIADSIFAALQEFIIHLNITLIFRSYNFVNCRCQFGYSCFNRRGFSLVFNELFLLGLSDFIRCLGVVDFGLGCRTCLLDLLFDVLDR